MFDLDMRSRYSTHVATFSSSGSCEATHGARGAARQAEAYAAALAGREGLRSRGACSFQRPPSPVLRAVLARRRTSERSSMCEEKSGSPFLAK
eukprot:1338797-Prymnesium_polylepis.1